LNTLTFPPFLHRSPRFLPLNRGRFFCRLRSYRSLRIIWASTEGSEVPPSTSLLPRAILMHRGFSLWYISWFEVPFPRLQGSIDAPPLLSSDVTLCGFALGLRPFLRLRDGFFYRSPFFFLPRLFIVPTTPVGSRTKISFLYSCLPFRRSGVVLHAPLQSTSVPCTFFLPKAIRFARSRMPGSPLSSLDSNFYARNPGPFLEGNPFLSSPSGNRPSEIDFFGGRA